MGDTSAEQTLDFDTQDNNPKSAIKKNVHLAPMEHKSQYSRNQSVPPLSKNNGFSPMPAINTQEQLHPINFAPMSSKKGGGKGNLGTIDHSRHVISELNDATQKITPLHNFPSPAHGKGKFQLEPLK